MYKIKRFLKLWYRYNIKYRNAYWAFLNLYFGFRPNDRFKGIIVPKGINKKKIHIYEDMIDDLVTKIYVKRRRKSPLFSIVCDRKGYHRKFSEDFFDDDFPYLL